MCHLTPGNTDPLKSMFHVLPSQSPASPHTGSWGTLGREPWAGGREGWRKTCRLHTLSTADLQYCRLVTVQTCSTAAKPEVNLTLGERDGRQSYCRQRQLHSNTAADAVTVVGGRCSWSNGRCPPLTRGKQGLTADS